MQKLLTTGLFQTSKAATTDIDGLVVAIAAAGTTDCGGLDTNDFTTWGAQRDTSTTKLSLATLNTQERAAGDGDDRVSLWVTTDAIYGYVKMPAYSAMNKATFLKVGEALTGNPEPSPDQIGKGVETGWGTTLVVEGTVQTANLIFGFSLN